MKRYLTILFWMLLSVSHAQHAFETRDWTGSIGTSFLTYSYGYGNYVQGAPVMISFEYGIHSYVGVSIYGGMMYRNPKINEYRYKQSLYAAGIRVNGHFYNVLDDFINADLKSNIVDIYTFVSLGMDHTVTDLPINPKTVYYISGGIGLKAYPFKLKRIGVMTEIGHSVITPLLLGVTFKL